MTGTLAAFVEEAYQDTLSLMTELRDYLSALQGDKPAASDMELRTRVIGEISTMTRNLTEAMAWLLLQKAAAAGEISGSEAATRSDGLMELAATAPQPAAGAPQLPIEMRGYIDRSRRLYDQIMRLREMTDRSVVREAGSA